MKPDGSQLKEKEIQAHLQMALEARKFSHAPYSNYNVGAIILTESGQTFTGCNVENVSVGCTICAEQTAMVKAISAGCRDVRAIFVASPGPKIAAPCGICRQFLSEFCSEQTEVFLTTEFDGGKLMQKMSFGQLFPFGYDSSYVLSPKVPT